MNFNELFTLLNSYNDTDPCWYLYIEVKNENTDLKISIESQLNTLLTEIRDTKQTKAQ